ncbi:MAG: tetratricopeptide repeat protein, partial [Selenomonadaceae bacterium]|nr:tetratricopeptide repeat protein [Selenomonadaceae bacterium]
SWAAKCFERNEKVRAINFGDVDELALFYRANCLAQLGDFNAAAELYEKILAIKSDFPEAKKNLGAIRGGATKNFSLEVQSLWNFSYWRDVPIFINARDRLGVMKKLIGWLLDAGYRKIFVLDNRSTYPPLLEYYSVLEKDSRIKIIRLKKNFGFKALWLSGILERLKISTPYIYTDPDVIPIERCPKDFVKRLMKLLDENREVRKVGLGLVYEDITFPEKDYIQETEANLYDGTRVGDDFHFVQIDTTLALYSNVRHYSLRLSLRTSGDLRVYHLPWYFDYDNLPADEKYYLEHADKNSVTSVKNFLS